jgi:hypothetical protein
VFLEGWLTIIWVAAIAAIVIQPAAPKPAPTEINTRKAVRSLQSKFSYDGRFNRLTHSTVEGWFCRTADASGNQGIIWQEKVLIRVQNRKSMFLSGTGRNGILNSHPEIVALISDMLKNMRKTGCIVNGTVAHAIIVGIL